MKYRAKRTDNGFIMIFCLGCGHHHALNVWNDERPKWAFNGDYERPTFTPSLKVEWGHYISEHAHMHDGRACQPGECGLCHTIITNGYINFLSDCTHNLRGVHELPAAWDENWIFDRTLYK